MGSLGGHRNAAVAKTYPIPASLVKWLVGEVYRVTALEGESFGPNPSPATYKITANPISSSPGSTIAGVAGSAGMTHQARQATGGGVEDSPEPEKGPTGCWGRGGGSPLPAGESPLTRRKRFRRLASTLMD